MDPLDVNLIRTENYFEKAPTGIEGLDAITYGGLPASRPTLISGGPGCGKTVLSMEFLVNGALYYEEPGLFISFETRLQHLMEDFQTMTLPLEELMAENKLGIEFVELKKGLNWSGDFNLETLVPHLTQAIEKIGAKRVAMDSMEKLYAFLPNVDNLRWELESFFEWLRERKITTVVTAEQGGGSSTYNRRGFEPYISDCVILLDHRIEDQISKRRMRIVKYRGSQHGKDEYPYVIGEDGYAVFPISSAELEYKISTEQISTGIGGLDEMLDGKGIFRGSAVLVTGKSGTGKSTLASSFTKAACGRGEKVQYLSFEESPNQIIRNMRSVGLDLQPYVDSGLLRFSAFRPTFRGLEEHLIMINSIINQFGPDIVVMDPISSLIDIGSAIQVKSMLTRVFDMIKAQGMTLFLTALTKGTESPEQTELGMSSLMDTWISLNYLETDMIRDTLINVIKSRGIKHSTSKQRFLITSNGVQITGY